MMFTYYLRKTVRDRAYMFWSLVFPILLMLCFNVTFMGPSKWEVDFQPVESAMIRLDSGDSAFADEFENVLLSLSDKEAVKKSNMGYDHEIINLTSVASREEAEKKIIEKDLSVLFLVDGENETIDVKVGEGASMTTLMIARGIVESYRRNYTIVKDTMMHAPDKFQAVMESLSQSVSVMKPKSSYLSGSGSSPNVYMWYFYSTIVMAMFFNVTAGVHTVFDIQGNLSGFGMRTSVSPKKKWEILLSAFLARYVVACGMTFFTILFMNKAFDVPLGNRFPHIALFVLVGNLFAMSLGSLFGLFTRGDENSRDNKVTCFVMISVFLSGEMIVNLPGLIEKFCPIVNRINPATIMNLAFFRLVNYPTLDGFWMNMIKIGLATVVFLTIAILKLRREKYAAL